MADVFGENLTEKQVRRYTGRLDQLAGIIPFEFTDGPARGMPALRIQTGLLDVTSLSGRALDLAHATYRGVPLCWRSRDGDSRPTFYEPEGTEFLRTFFGGLMTTCGLTNFGPGGTDEDGTFPLHGRIDHQPAENVSWSEEWDGDECVFEVGATIRQTRVFGEDLVLKRHLRTRLGGRSIEVHDTVTNRDDGVTPHMFLYHCNGGFPILAPGARLHVSHSSFRPRDAEAAKGVEVWNEAIEPQPRFREQVFIHTPIRLDDGLAAVALINEELEEGNGLGLLIRFDPNELPALFTWRMMGEGTYVMGMEPANCPTIEGRVAARKAGTLPFLQPGETREYHVRFEVLRGRDEIGDIVEQIDRVNAGASS